MSNKRIDPRILRTRKLIVTAFFKLLNEREFTSITIKDITQEAGVNRATFYYHFTDKYHLIESVTRDDLRIILDSRLGEATELSDKYVKEAFISVVNITESYFDKYSCKVASFMDVFERAVKDELYQLFYNQLKINYKNSTPETLAIAANLSSWSIYGGVVQWSKDKSTPLSSFLEPVAKYIINGIIGMVQFNIIANAG